MNCRKDTLKEQIKITLWKIKASTLFSSSILIYFILQAHLLFSQTCDSTQKSFPGAVQLRTLHKQDLPGSILKGCIHILSNARMHTAPKLTDSTGHSKYYYGRDTWAYWYINHRDTVYYLNSGSKLRSKWIFLRRLEKGPMELYAHLVTGTSFSTLSYTHYEYYYLRKNGEWLNKKPVVWNETGKRKALNKIFSGCPAVLDRIAKTSNLLLDDEIIGFVRLYNKNCGTHR